MRNKQNSFYKTNLKGISLIVLIITIIVIIILSTAILVSVINNNSISEANKARYESDRDNMQAVFTSTVGKIMAKELGTVNIIAGQINTETTGVSETTGEVAYTVNNAMISANASGKIVFDKGTNDATTYYTGKKLPIYQAGETKWYVDSEGILSLEVAGVKYGSGETEKIAYKSLGNWEHEVSNGIVEVHDTESGICSKCGENVLVPGLYDENDNLIASWDEFMNAYGISLEENQSTGNAPKMWLFFNSNYTTATKIVISPTVTSIGKYSFWCAPFSSIIIPNSVTEIGASAFSECKSLTSIIIPKSVDDVGIQAFDSCKNLTTITILNGVTSIGKAAFISCEKLTSAYIPSSVTSILTGTQVPYAGIFMYSNSELKIYCEATKQPEGWNDGWNTQNPANLDKLFNVTWGVTREEYEALIAE